MVKSLIRRPGYAILIFLFAFALNGQESSLIRNGDQWLQVVTGSVPLGDADSFRASLGTEVRVEAAPGGFLTYEYRKTVSGVPEDEARRLLGADKLVIARAGGELSVRMIQAAGRLVSGNITLAVPLNLRQYVIETRYGDIRASELNGKTKLETGGGRITVDRLHGPLIARTAAGQIILGRVDSSVHCITGGGNIRVTSVAGESWFDTTGGEVLIGEAGGPVHASTGAGNIQVTSAASTVSAKTQGGMIKIGSAKGAVSAENLGGSIQVGSAPGVHAELIAGLIRLDGVSGEVNASTAMGTIIAALLEGQPLRDSYLSSSSGDVTVLIPSNLAVRVLAWNETGSQAGWIVSDFPEIHVEPGRLGSRVMAAGQLNGGGPLLRISASGGKIYLRRKP